MVTRLNSDVFRILERGQDLSAEGWMWEGTVPHPQKIFQFVYMKMACSDALWNTVLGLVCLQQKASRQMSI